MRSKKIWFQVASICHFYIEDTTKVHASKKKKVQSSFMLVESLKIAEF